MKPKFFALCVVLLATILSACAEAARPIYPTCPANVIAMVGEKKLAEESMNIIMLYNSPISGVGNSTYDFLYQVKDKADKEIEDAIGMEQPHGPQAILVEDVSSWGVENLDSTVHDVINNGIVPASCPKDWVITYTMQAYSGADPDKPDREWSISAHTSNNVAYFTIFSTGGSVEIPIPNDTLTQIVTGEYNQQTAAASITLEDPTTQIGPDSYEKTTILASQHISSKGQQVGRFRWTTLEGQNTINHILAQSLILRAWSVQATKIQAAWVGFMGNGIYRSTNLSIQNSGVSGSFFLGIGYVSGGGGQTTFNEVTSTSPTVYGDLYFLAK